MEEKTKTAAALQCCVTVCEVLTARQSLHGMLCVVKRVLLPIRPGHHGKMCGMHNHQSLCWLVGRNQTRPRQCALELGHPIISRGSDCLHLAAVASTCLCGPARAPECARFKTLLYSPERAPLGLLCFFNQSGPQRAPEVSKTGTKRAPEGPSAVKLAFWSPQARFWNLCFGILDIVCGRGFVSFPLCNECRQ